MAVTEARAREQKRLLLRYARLKKPQDLARLVELWKPLAISEAKKRIGVNNEPFEDLLQVALLGLVNALNRYDPSRNTSFTTFAIPTIRGELFRHFRDRTWTVYMPRTLKEQVAKAYKLDRLLLQTEHRHPTRDELATHLDIPLSEVDDVLGAIRARDCDSLSQILHIEDGSELEDMLADDRLRFVPDLLSSVDLRRCLQGLTPFEREFIRLRFEEELTQGQLAKRLGVSQMQVSRYLRCILSRLKCLYEGSSPVQGPPGVGREHLLLGDFSRVA